MDQQGAVPSLREWSGNWAQVPQRRSLGTVPAGPLSFPQTPDLLPFGQGQAKGSPRPENRGGSFCGLVSKPQSVWVRMEGTGRRLTCIVHALRAGRGLEEMTADPTNTAASAFPWLTMN